MNYFDARGLRYKAESDRMEESKRASEAGGSGGREWQPVGKQKKVETVEDFATMLGGNMNKLFRD